MAKKFSVENIKYIKYFWEPLFGTKNTAIQRQKELMVDSNNYMTISGNMRDFRAFGGKYWEAEPKFLVNPIEIPEFKVSPLSNSLSQSIQTIIKGSMQLQPSLLLFAFKENAYNDMLKYHEEWARIHGSDSDAPKCNLVFVGDNPFLKLFAGFMRSSLKKRLGDEIAEKVYTSIGQDFSDVRMKLGMRNVLVPWAFLIHDQRVVWTCHAKPTEKELTALESLSLELAQYSRVGKSKKISHQ